MSSRPLIALCLALTACPGGDDGAEDSGTTTPTPTSGEPTAGTADGGPGDATQGPGSDDDPTTTPMPTTGTTDPDTGPGDDSTTTGIGGDPGQWLLVVDNAASPPALVQHDLGTGQSTQVCSLAASTTYDSIAFAHDGILYADNVGNARIDRLNPCNCGFQIVGGTSTGPLALTHDAADGLFGVDANLDALATVDTGTGLANVIGGFGVDVVGVAAAYSDSMTGVYMIDDATDQLLAIDDATGLATPVVTLSEDVTNPGMAVHPDGTFYVCSGTTLYELDTFNGVLTMHSTLGLAGACSNLTAPQTGIECLD